MRIGYLERHDPDRNMRRFYAIHITQTLFDDWALIREWGRVGQPGTVREIWFETEASARQAGIELRSRKERRGYTPILIG